MQPCVLQCDGLKMELQELQVMYDSSQRERAELEEELQRCKAELEKLAQVSEGSSFQFQGFMHKSADWSMQQRLRAEASAEAGCFLSSRLA